MISRKLNPYKKCLNSAPALLIVVMALLASICVQSFVFPKHFILQEKKLIIDLQSSMKSNRRERSFARMWPFSDTPTTVFRTKELTRPSKDANSLQLQTHRNASIARIFSKLGEDRVIIDLSTGKCCFSACPGCDFYNDDGTYQYEEFRVLKACNSTEALLEGQQTETVAAWIPTYAYRSVGGANIHRAKWMLVLFPTEKDKAITKDLFCQKLFDSIGSSVIESKDVVPTDSPKSHLQHASDDMFLKLPTFPRDSQSPVSSTKMIQMMEHEKYDKEAIHSLWRILTSFPGDKVVSSSSLTKGQIVNRLKNWHSSSGTTLEGLSFSSFANRLAEVMHSK